MAGPLPQPPPPELGEGASPLDAVRDGCRAVAERAQSVRIRHERIAAYAASLPFDEMAAATLDTEHHYLGPADATVAFFLTLDSINFGSGYFPHLTKRDGMSGYFTIATSLKERFEAQGPLSAEELQRLTAVDCARLFGQALDDGPVEEVMSLFATALHDLGAYLQQAFTGDFTRLIEAAGESAARLVELLAAMPFFQDVEPYEELRVPFYKRAQLTAADLALAFQGRDCGHFADLDRLTIFADNLVPHVLRLDGLLGYDDTLLARIEAGELIPAGSAEEVEIRACAVHVVELLVAAAREQGHALTAQQLDYLLWTRGQQPRYKARPRHRTRTVYY